MRNQKYYNETRANRYASFGIRKSLTFGNRILSNSSHYPLKLEGDQRNPKADTILPKKNNYVGTQEPENLSGKVGSKSSRRLFGYLRQLVPQMRPASGVVGLRNGILNTGTTRGSLGISRNLTARYNVRILIHYRGTNFRI
jgi:hypothetical protein